MIDVSQSIEHEHPAAFDFLRSDIQNAEDFFARRGVRTLGLRRTFNLVTRDSWVKDRDETDDDAAEEVKRLLAEEDGGTATTAGPQPDGSADRPADRSASDEAVFAQSYIPRTLDQVYDVERDVARVLRGEGSDLIYADLTGVASVQKAQQDRSLPAVAEDAGDEAKVGEAGDEDDSVSDGAEGSGDSTGEEEESADGVRRPRGKKFEDKDEKKVGMCRRSPAAPTPFPADRLDAHAGQTARSQGESTREARCQDEERRESPPHQEIEWKAMTDGLAEGFGFIVYGPPVACCVLSLQISHAAFLGTASLRVENGKKGSRALQGCVALQQARVHHASRKPRTETNGVRTCVGTCLEALSKLDASSSVMSPSTAPSTLSAAPDGICERRRRNTSRRLGAVSVKYESSSRGPLLSRPETRLCDAR